MLRDVCNCGEGCRGGSVLELKIKDGGGRGTGCCGISVWEVRAVRMDLSQGY